MARLAQIETQKLALANGATLPFILLPEEQHNLTRNPHALLAYIAHRLADLREGMDQSWIGSMFQWPDPTREIIQWDESSAAVEHQLDLAFANTRGIAVVVIENFDFLLANVFKEEAEQRLRKWLDRPNNRVMLIATATGSVDMDYDRPLFQAFQAVQLEPWAPDTCIEYFNRRREAEGKWPLDGAMEAKARAIADFIGGNPRLAHLLANVIETQDALSVADTMNALADKLSDYYRRRIDDLPPLAQGLLDALLRGGEPASQTQLAERVGAPGQSAIARLMGDLQRADIIRGVPAKDSRETLYRVTDRVFVHFYRLRQGNRLTKITPLATILDFLRAFYSRDEQKFQAMRHLEAGRPAEARIFADLARESGTPAIGLSTYAGAFAVRLTYLEAANANALPLPAQELLTMLDDSPERVVGIFDNRSALDPVDEAACEIVTAHALARIGLVDEAEARLNGAINENRDPLAQLLLRHELGTLLFNCREDSTSSNKLAEYALDMKIARLHPLLKRLALLHRIAALSERNDPQAGLVQARALAKLALEYGDRSGEAKALLHVVECLRDLGRSKDALKAARKAAEIAADIGETDVEAHALILSAWILRDAKKHQESLETAEYASGLYAQLNDVSGQLDALRICAYACHAQRRFEDAIEIDRKILTLASESEELPTRVEAKRHIAASLRGMGEYKGALEQALEAFALAKDISDKWKIGSTASEAIEAAVYISSSEALDCFKYWVEISAEPGDDDRVLDWHLWLAEAVGASARVRNWSLIDSLISTQTVSTLTEVMFFAEEIGRAILRTLTDEGRAAAFDATRGALPHLAKIFGSESEAFHEHLTDVIAEVGENCRDAGFLRDIAILLTSDLSPRASELADLLLALAQVDEADDAQALLARMDPDIAIWLRRVRNLPEPAGAKGARGIRGRKA
jgi:tetratricopeptide (TPR) repeat protein